MKKKFAFVSVVVLAATFGAAAPSVGGPILMSYGFSGSDCNGVFGNPTDPCDVGTGLQVAEQISPFIVKFDGDGTVDELNPDFSSITGSEFAFNGTTGTWSYTPGPNDPVVRYWVAKGGSNFNLFWYVESTTVGNTCDSPAYNAACLQLALAVTSGTFTTPINPANGRPFGLSHITFYDTGDLPEVPEPGSVLLLGTGLAAAAIAARRRRARRA